MLNICSGLDTIVYLGSRKSVSSELYSRSSVSVTVTSNIASITSELYLVSFLTCVSLAHLPRFRSCFPLEVLMAEISLHIDHRRTEDSEGNATLEDPIRLHISSSTSP